MIQKKVLLLSLIIVLMASLGVISATDVEDNATSMTTQVTADHASFEKHDALRNTEPAKNTKTVEKTNQKPGKSSTNKEVKSYDELYEVLTGDADSDLVVSLGGEDSYKISRNITLNQNIKNLVLEGNGRTIDGNNSKTFLNINHSSNIILNNITIANCNDTQERIFVYYATTYAKGAAINAYNINLTLNNSVFTGNGADGTEASGGAIYLENSTLTINNCTFSSNWIDSGYGQEGGGAIYTYDSNITVTQSNFINNRASLRVSETGYVYGEGGAILAYNSNINVNDSKFISNTAHTGSGISIYGNDSIITNSLFEDNVDSYGAVYNYAPHGYYTQDEIMKGNLIMDNVTFNSNHFTGMDYIDGLAIVNYGNLSINNSFFTGNYLDGDEVSNYGGMLGHFGSELLMDNCLFDGNYVNSMDDRGALLSIRGNNSRVMNTNFTNNRIISEDDGTGGAISNMAQDYLIVENCNFINNSLESSEAEGGAIHSYSNLTVISSNFINNSIRSNEYDAAGGAISSHSNLIVEDCNFTFNNVEGHSTRGGAISAQGESISINNTNFYYNSIRSTEDYAYGGAVEAGACNNISIDNSKFFFNQASDFQGEVRGGGLYAGDSDYKEYYYVKNNGFSGNNPATFIVRDEQIVINNMDEYGNIIDYTIPTQMNVIIYRDESTEGEEYVIEDSVVRNFVASNREYVYKLVVSLPEDTDIELFRNNVFYVKLSQTFTLSVNVDDIKAGHNQTIDGIFYYNDTDGVTTYFEDRQIELYINGTFINRTTTNENGEYNFTFTPTGYGIQDVLVKFPGDEYLNPITNTTTFNIEELKTKLIFNQINETSINNKTNITGKLLDEEQKALQYENFTLYINNNPINITTDENGEFQYEYLTAAIGENHVLGIYGGNNYYSNTMNMTNFNVGKRITRIDAAQDVNVRDNVTIDYGVEDITIGETPITEGTVTVYEEENIIKSVKFDEERNTLTITDLEAGLHALTIVYNGNDTYNRSSMELTVKQLPKANITISVVNHTEGNVTLEITVINGTDPIGDAYVTITLPNGSTTTKKTDNKGRITVSDPTAKAGDRTTTAAINSTDKYVGTTETKDVYVVEDYQKIIEQLKQTITELNNTIEQQKQTIENMNETIKELNNTIEQQQKTINELKETISSLNNTILEKNEIIKQLNDTITQLEKEIRELEEAIDAWNKTSVMRAVAENGTVDDTHLIVTLENMLTDSIVDAPLKAVNSIGETIGTGTTDAEGVAIIPLSTRSGTEDVTVVYDGDAMHFAVNKTLSVTTVKNNVTLTVDPVEGIVGENIKLTAYLTDIYGNPISGGNLVFKLNGKTLRADGRFDSNASALKFKVNNGLVTITIQADLYLRNAKNITASYSGTYKFNEAKSEVVTAQIKKRNAQLSVKVSPTKQKQYGKITFTATVKDTTPNHKNNTSINEGNQVLFKINGITIKDAKGNNLLVNVSKNKATYKYTVPQGMGGISKDGSIRKYNVTALFVSSTFYPDTRNDTYFNVERSPVTININKITVNSKNQLSIKADLKDYKNKYLIGTNQVNIKINGKTYVNPKTNKTQNFEVTDGKVDLTNLQINSSVKIKSVTIVTGARQAYLGQRIETTNIVKV